MKVMIAGGAGFIGYHLAMSHLKSGDTVIVVDNLFKTDGAMDEELGALVSSSGVEYLRIDLTKPFADRIPFTSVDVVYHLAAINGTRLFYEIPYQLARANLLMTLNLLEALEGKSVGRLVYASTSEVYAGCENVGLLTVPTNESIPVVFPQPTDVRFSYGTSKFMGEFLCFRFGQHVNIPTSVVRYHNIYGPRMGSKHVIPEFILRIRDHERPFRTYGGNETRAFCYVDDAVEATRAVAISDTCSGEIIHIGNSKEEIQILDLAKAVMSEMGEDLPIVEQGRRSGSVSRRCPDTSKLRKLTGFEAKVSLKDGLRRTVGWYLSRMAV